MDGIAKLFLEWEGPAQCPQWGEADIWNGTGVCRVSAPMTRHKLHDEPTKVAAKDGEVILNGPDDVHVKMTPEAAEQTSDNLFVGAMKARGKQRLKNHSHKQK